MFVTTTIEVISTTLEIKAQDTKKQSNVGEYKTIKG